MRIAFHKVSGDQHVLEVVHEGGQRESVECETRSYLMHDLLHYALEAEANLATGVWGSLASGKTLAELNTRDGLPVATGPDMLMIEQLAGALSGVMKGQSGEAFLEGLRQNADALAWSIPDWLTPRFVEAVRERMRQLLGRWNATSFGGTLELS